MTAETPASVTPPETWNYAANEIRREASIRGDLDERTVQALAAHLDRISMGYSEPNLTRDARHAQQRAKPETAAPSCTCGSNGRFPHQHATLCPGWSSAWPRPETEAHGD